MAIRNPNGTPTAVADYWPVKRNVGECFGVKRRRVVLFADGLRLLLAKGSSYIMKPTDRLWNFGPYSVSRMSHGLYLT